MSDNIEYVRIAHAIYPAADWPDVVLYAGEIGWESDTGKFKRGDGYRKWSDLPYYEQTKIGEKIIATEDKVQESINVIEGKVQEVTDGIIESLNSYAKTADVESTYAKKNDLTDYATKTWVGNQDYVTNEELQNLELGLNEDEVKTII